MTSDDSHDTADPADTDGVTTASDPATTPAPMPPPAALAQAITERTLRTARVWNVILSIVVVLAVAVLVWVLVARPTAAPVAEPTPTPTQSADDPVVVADDGIPLADQVARNDPEDRLAFGPIDAPVVIIEWVDYRCPYCAVYTNDTFPRIMADYVDTGLVRYEVHDVAFFGDFSVDAAVAARAAAEQDMFEEYMVTLFAAAPPQGQPDMPRDTLVQFATDAGVPDIDAFTAALDRQDLRDDVLRATSTAQQLGITSTPFFLVDDVTLAGAQPYEVFQQAIDEQLAVAAAG